LVDPERVATTVMGYLMKNAKKQQKDPVRVEAKEAAAGSRGKGEKSWREKSYRIAEKMPRKLPEISPRSVKHDDGQMNEKEEHRQHFKLEHAHATK
ncbi:unnamed protein product, partial [Heterosigma akashiwo]